jgi:hypothetical protein
MVSRVALWGFSTGGFQGLSVPQRRTCGFHDALPFTKTAQGHVCRPFPVICICSQGASYRVSRIGSLKGSVLAWLHSRPCCLPACLPACLPVLQGRKLLSPNASSSSSNAHQSGSSATAAALAAAARSAGQAAVSTGVDVAAGTLDFFLMEIFDRDRDNMW